MLKLPNNHIKLKSYCNKLLTAKCFYKAKLLLAIKMKLQNKSP